jgi:hypothetical protein
MKREYNAHFIFARIAFKRTPNGHEFINWISNKWRQWEKIRGKESFYHSKEDLIDFRKWLYQEVKA